MSPTDAHEHSHSHHPSAGPGTAIDPVCGMTVDPASAAGRSEHAGKTYYFCAVSCKQKFDRDPARYLSEKATEPHLHQINVSTAPQRQRAAAATYTCPMHPQIVRD